MNFYQINLGGNIMFEVKNIVCDYGLYENGELKLILNSRRNALLIKAIIEKDNLCNKSSYIFNEKDFERFMEENNEYRRND